jgi:hypothetical protein
MRDSDRTYRVAAGLYTAMGLIALSAYARLAVLGGRQAQGALLASTLLIQPIGISVWVARQRFMSRTAAAIRSAAATVAIGWFPFLALIPALFGRFQSSWDADRLQLGFVSTVLVLGGLAGGTTLGILRWRQQAGQTTDVSQQPSEGRWGRYRLSVVLWMASIASYLWLIEAWRWAKGASHGNELVFGMEVAVAGLLLVAGAAGVAPPSANATRDSLILRYAKASLAGTLIITLVLLFQQLGNYVIVLVFSPWLLLLYWAAVWVPVLAWAVLLAWCERPSAGAISTRVPRNAALVAGGAAGQIVALAAGLLATIPDSMGMHGIGCLATYRDAAREYWFWKAYKGVASEAISGTRIVFRPAVDRSVCIAVAAQDDSLRAPREIAGGYLTAARSWFWLIDPDRWDDARTKQIRVALAGLLGRDFTTYAELETWWQRNYENLVWSAERLVLEVRDPTPSERVWSWHGGPASAVENIRADPSLLSDDPRTHGAELFDRAARVRGLMLRAADEIDVLTGERARRARERLRLLVDRDFSTTAEWRSFLAQDPPPSRWRISRVEAQDWIADIEPHDSLPDSARSDLRYLLKSSRLYQERVAARRRERESVQHQRLETLQTASGLGYKRLDAFLPWLKDPQNTRREDWDAARQIATKDLCADNEALARGRPLTSGCAGTAIFWLHKITGQGFTAPEEWISWWRLNTDLVLSADGTRLVTFTHEEAR